VTETCLEQMFDLVCQGVKACPSQVFWSLLKLFLYVGLTVSVCVCVCVFVISV